MLRRLQRLVREAARDGPQVVGWTQRPPPCPRWNAQLNLTEHCCQPLPWSELHPSDAAAHAQAGPGEEHAGEIGCPVPCLRLTVARFHPRLQRGPVTLAATPMTIDVLAQDPRDPHMAEGDAHRDGSRTAAVYLLALLPRPAARPEPDLHRETRDPDAGNNTSVVECAARKKFKKSFGKR